MKKTESKKRFYVLNLHLLSGVQYRNIVPIVQTHLQGCFQRSLYEEFLRATVERSQRKTTVHYTKQYHLQFHRNYYQTNVVRQLNPVGSGTSFQVSLIVPGWLAPNSTIMWLKPLLEMNYTEFPIYEPSSCELSEYKRVLTHPITQSHNSRVWCTSSRVCILYRALCVCVLYWAVVYDVCGFEKADEEAKRQLTDPQREPRGGPAKG